MYDRAQSDSVAAFFRKLSGAAASCQKASTGGNSTAKMQLARLTERGLDVAQDKLLVVICWGQATGTRDEPVFTRELLVVLRENKGVLHGEQLFGYLRDRVKYTVDGDEINQTPTFGSIERAGHESGQFVFLRGGV